MSSITPAQARLTTAEPVGPHAEPDLSEGGATMPGMTNTTSNTALPAGTTWDGEWDEGMRDCYSRARTIAASGWLRDDVRVYIHVLQRPDGEITEQVIVPPDLHPDHPLTSAQARQIGEALIATADEFDAMTAAAVAK